MKVLAYVWNICRTFLLCAAVVGCASGAGHDVYHARNMDFGSIQSVAVMPFTNLTHEQAAAERVRDVFMTMLLASGSIYVIPPGEVARGISMAGVTRPAMPSSNDVKKLAAALKADAVITGTVREYGEIRQGAAAATIISVSAQLLEAQTGTVVWSASSTQGGIGFSERMFGGGGEPLNVITEKAINEILDKLFQ